MTLTLQPVEIMDNGTSTFGDLKSNFDIHVENTIAIRDYVCSLETLIGNLGDLDTACQSSLVCAINEVLLTSTNQFNSLSSLISGLSGSFRYESLTNNSNGTYTFDNDNGGTTLIDTRDTAIRINGTLAGISSTNVHGALAEIIADITALGSITISPASTTVQGIVELATSAEAQAGTDTTRAVTPAALASVTATDTRRGLIELATDAEVQVGSDDARAVTPAGLKSLTSTDTRRGLIEIATDAEVKAGIDDTKAVTPFTLSYVGPCLAPTATGAEVAALTGNEKITMCIGGDIKSIQWDQCLRFRTIASGIIQGTDFVDMINDTNVPIADGYKTPGASRTAAQDKQWWINTGIAATSRSQSPGKYRAYIKQSGSIGGSDGVWWEEVEIINLTRWWGPHRVFIRVIPRLGPGVSSYEIDSFEWELQEYL